MSTAPTPACSRMAERPPVRGDGALRMTPVEAIRSATVNAAEALGAMMSRDRAGRHADLIAVPGDPTQNVALLENVAS